VRDEKSRLWHLCAIREIPDFTERNLNRSFGVPNPRVVREPLVHCRSEWGGFFIVSIFCLANGSGCEILSDAKERSERKPSLSPVSRIVGSGGFNLGLMAALETGRLFHPGIPVHTGPLSLGNSLN